MERSSPFVDGEDSTHRALLEKAGALSRGIRDGTSRQERVERGRPRLARIATATGGSRPQAETAGPDEESDGSVVPVKAVKAAGGKGPCSKTRPQQGRKRRLWRH